VVGGAQPYDPAWAIEGRRIRQAVLDVVSRLTPVIVDHVGPTSVRGLAAEPVIDVLVAAADLEVAMAAVGTIDSIQHARRQVIELGDDERVTIDQADAQIVGAHGVLALAPELVLLFKSGPAESEPRPKNACDIERILPTLDSKQRRRLTEALAVVYPDQVSLAIV
jgi:GrpB protein